MTAVETTPWFEVYCRDRIRSMMRGLGPARMLRLVAEALRVVVADQAEADRLAAAVEVLASSCQPPPVEIEGREET